MSRCIPFASLHNPDTGTYLTPEQLRAVFDDVDVDATEQIITYFGSGVAATNDAFALVMLGYENVAVYDASMSEWGHDVERFRKMEAAGDDLAGEARFVDAMAPRHGRILDAGCGPGRVASILADLGHYVVGVDVARAAARPSARERADSGWLWRGTRL